MSLIMQHNKLFNPLSQIIIIVININQIISPQNRIFLLSFSISFFTLLFISANSLLISGVTTILCFFKHPFGSLWFWHTGHILFRTLMSLIPFCENVWANYLSFFCLSHNNLPSYPTLLHPCSYLVVASIYSIFVFTFCR